jgi:hypothetical protein
LAEIVVRIVHPRAAVWSEIAHLTAASVPLAVTSRAAINH